jgi:uncharacterized membrane protein
MLGRGLKRSAAIAAAACVTTPALAGAAPARTGHVRATAGESGTYEVVSAWSGKCLDVRGQATGNGSAVDQWTCNGGANQRWRVVQVGTSGGNVPILELIGVGSGKCLDVYGGSQANGATVDIWTCNGQGNQRWDDAFGANPRDLLDHATVGSASTKTLEIYGQSSANGGRVDIWDFGSSTTKGWSFR